MKKKLLWTVIFVLLAAAVVTILLILAKDTDRSAAEPSADPYATKEFTSLQEAVDYVEFRLVHSDRLNGEQVVNYVCSKRKIVVNFGDGGFISKALLVEDEEAPSGETPEGDPQGQSFEQTINLNKNNTQVTVDARDNVSLINGKTPSTLAVYLFQDQNSYEISEFLI